MRKLLAEHKVYFSRFEHTFGDDDSILIGADSAIEPYAGFPASRELCTMGAYSYSDAIFLSSMIRHAKPKQIIEVGSGYSSCATNPLPFVSQAKITYVSFFLHFAPKTVANARRRLSA